MFAARPDGFGAERRGPLCLRAARGRAARGCLNCRRPVSTRPFGAL